MNCHLIYIIKTCEDEQNEKHKIKGYRFSEFFNVNVFNSTVLAATQYSVRPGAQFRWDATLYYFQDNEPLTDTEYTLSYYLEFEFKNWAGVSGAEYLNGTVNSNGTIFDGDMSHNLYYGWTPWGQEWVTDIIDYQHPTYPVHVYLICDTEIVQTTKPDLQDLATNSAYLTFGEPSANNFTLTGTFTDGSTYTGNVEFNSDKVLKYVYDEMIYKSSGDIVRIERYIWTLTYTPGTGAAPGNGSSIPGFQLTFIIGAMTVGFIFILKKHKKTR